MYIKLQFLVIGLIGLGFTVSAQEQNRTVKTELKSVETSKSVSTTPQVMENNGQKTIVNPDGSQTISRGTPRTPQTKAQRIQAIDDHIKAIDTKVAHVKADAVQAEKAQADGWFDQMNNIKSELIAEKQSLLKDIQQDK